MTQSEKARMVLDLEDGRAWSIHCANSGPAGSASTFLLPRLQASFEMTEPSRLNHLFMAETGDQHEVNVSRAMVGLLVGQKAVEVMLDPDSHLDEEGWAEVPLEGSEYSRKIAGRLALLRECQEVDYEQNGLNSAWNLEAAYLLNELSKQVPESEFLKRSAYAEALVAVTWLRGLSGDQIAGLHIFSDNLFVPVEKLIYTAMRLTHEPERQPIESGTLKFLAAFRESKLFKKLFE